MADFIHEVNQLCAGILKLRGVGLQRVGMAVVAVIVIPDVAIGIIETCGGVTAFPQVAVAGTEEVFAVLEITLVDGLKQFIDTLIGFLAVALDVEPQAAVSVAHSGPDSGTAEEVIAEHLTHIGWVVLEPLEVEFANALDGVGIIIDIFAQVESEVGVVPVGVVSLVHLSLPALGTAARSVALRRSPTLSMTVVSPSLTNEAVATTYCVV